MRLEQRILIVDDERVIADSLATILNQSGYEARAVYSGEEALELTTSFAPDLMICDVVMGGLNGVETALLMRESFPQIKVLLFSGTQSSVELLSDAQRRGHNFDFLSKPVHPKDLLSHLAVGGVRLPSSERHKTSDEMQADSATRH
jgi:CheY-like chemotaxis protein